MVPALPASDGPNPARAKFFAEAAAAFEVMSLFYELTANEQRDLKEHIQSLAAAVAQRTRPAAQQKGNRS